MKKFAEIQHALQRRGEAEIALGALVAVAALTPAIVALRAYAEEEPPAVFLICWNGLLSIRLESQERSTSI